MMIGWYAYDNCILSFYHYFSMSGHSRWSKIQHKKGKTDKARSNLFTKLCRAITIAAQQGGGDPDMNFSLRMAIDKAKEGNVPKDNIERAIKNGTGELKEGVVLEEALYEGFGPGGVAFLVECVTDNKNRTVSEVKHAFGKNGGSMGGPGSVQWQFEHLGVVRIGESEKSKIKSLMSGNEFELSLIDAGVEDIIESEFGLEIRCARELFQKVLEAVQVFDLKIEDSGLEWVAKEEIDVEEAVSEKVGKLYEIFDELDDVKGIYTNEK